MAKDESRRTFLKLAARRPEGGECEIQISYDRMQAVGRRSMGHAKVAAFIVPLVLQSPTSVFEGLRRDEDEDRQGYGWRCYCGVPDRAYRSTEHSAAAILAKFIWYLSTTKVSPITGGGKTRLRTIRTYRRTSQVVFNVDLN